MKRCRDRNIVQFLGTAVDREQASADDSTLYIVLLQVSRVDCIVYIPMS